MNLSLTCLIISAEKQVRSSSQGIRAPPPPGCKHERAVAWSRLCHLPAREERDLSVLALLPTCPVDAICERQLILCIKSGNRPDVEDIIESCPSEVIDIMRQCWEVSPDNRPTFAGESPPRRHPLPRGQLPSQADRRYLEFLGKQVPLLISN